MIDFVHLDALARQAFVSWGRWQELVRTDLDAAKRTDPFAATRALTGRSLLVELRAHKPSAGEAALHAGLTRWGYALLQARLSIPFVVEARTLVEAPHRIPAFAETLAWRALWHASLLAPAPRAAEYVKVLAECAPALCSVELRAREVRVEAAHRLGYGNPGEPLALDGDNADFARAFVTRTIDSAKEALRAETPFVTPLAPVAYARRELGLSAGEGWPSRLTARWFDEVFAGLGGVVRRMPAPRLPPVWGASSFGRSLAALGLALRSHHVLLSRLPFTDRAHPRELEGQTLAAAFCFLLLAPAFHYRALGLGRDAARDQARRCASALLLASRRALACSAVRSGDWAPDDAAHATYCGTEPSPLTRALLLRAPQSFGVAEGIMFTQLMVNRFDEDWFRNPRAHQFLVDRASAPAFATDRAAVPSAVECGQWFESQV